MLIKARPKGLLQSVWLACLGAACQHRLHKQGQQSWWLISSSRASVRRCNRPQQLSTCFTVRPCCFLPHVKRHQLLACLGACIHTAQRWWLHSGCLAATHAGRGPTSSLQRFGAVMPWVFQSPACTGAASRCLSLSITIKLHVCSNVSGERGHICVLISPDELDIKRSQRYWARAGHG